MLNLSLETTSTCNAACTFCPYPELARWGGKMDMNLFRKIIDETVDLPDISRITLHGLGEPLLDPHLEDRIWYIKKVNPLPVTIYTNGVYLTRTRHDKLAVAGLDTVVISLNAVRPEQHEKIMGLKGKFDTVVENCEYATIGPMNVEIHAVITGDTFTMDDKRLFEAEWGTYAHPIMAGNWAGDERTIRTFDPSSHCFRATRHIYVLYDGTVSACCFDPTGKMRFGDLSKQTIKEIYNSLAYRNFRQDHFENNADLYDICKNCTRI